jgi:hypothetical protein
MRTIFTFIAAMLFWQMAWTQLASEPKQVDPKKHFLSQMEIGVFYGLAYRRNKTHSNFFVNSYYTNQAEGKEFSVTGSFHLCKNLFLEYSHSRFVTTEHATGLIIPIDDDNFFYLLSEEFKLIRNGLSIQYQKQLKKTSYTRIHLGSGLARTKVNNAMTLDGNNTPFVVNLKSEAIYAPFFTIQFSTAILRKNIRIHAKYTQYFGKFETLTTQTNDFELQYTDDIANSLYQSTFQVGLSLNFNIKNPLKVKAP